MLVRDWHRRPLLARSNHLKTAIISGPRDIQVEEVDIPLIGPDDVLVRVKVSGICGSDVHRYLGTEYGRGYCNYPMNSGHEYCGDVVQVGNRVQEFREGEKVTHIRNFSPMKVMTAFVWLLAVIIMNQSTVPEMKTKIPVPVSVLR